VVVCHGLTASKDRGFFPELCDRLARAGFAVVSFTFVGTSDLLPQLEQVLRAVRDGSVGTTADRYGLIGHGTASRAAVLESAVDDRVRALVTWGAPAHDLLGAAGAVRAPWLIIHGAADDVVPPDDARMLHDAARGDSDLLLVEGAGHSFGAEHPWTGSNPAFERALRATVDWLARHLP
jgi:dienelactone hydrolase